MRRLSTAKRVQILQMLVEGSSMRSAARIAGVKLDTVTRLLVDAGRACRAIHDENVAELNIASVQCDEIWSFCHTKRKNLHDGSPEDAGDVWTYTAIDTDSRLIVTWYAGSRSTVSTFLFMQDLADRLANRVMLTSDGWKPYPDAVEFAFAGDVDYAQLIKNFEGDEPKVEKRVMSGRFDLDSVNTAYVERHNRTMRMSMKRFTRRSDAHSKKLENHEHALALYFVWYNFCRPHMSFSEEIPTTPAMVAEIAGEPYPMEWIIDRVNKMARKPNRPKFYKKKAA